MSHNFYICSSLLSTILDYPVTSNPISSNTEGSNKAFTDTLSNPCTLIDESSLESVVREPIPLRTTVTRMIDELSTASETTEALLKSEYLRELTCTASVFSPDDNILLAQHLSTNFTEDVIRLFYRSLVNHTAYVFFIFEQIKKCTSYCLLDVVLNEEGKLARKMQAVICSFRKLADDLPDSATDSMKDVQKPIFNEELIDLSTCSKLIYNTYLAVQNAIDISTQLIFYLRTIGSSQ